MAKATTLDGKLYVNANLPVIEEYDLYYVLREGINNGTIKEGVTFKEIVDALGNMPAGRSVCPRTAAKEQVYEIRCLDASALYRIGIEFDEEEKVSAINSSCLLAEGEPQPMQYIGGILKAIFAALGEENDKDQASALYERMKQESARFSFDLEGLKKEVAAFIDLDNMVMIQNPFRR